MRIITVQHLEVLNSILQNGIYEKLDDDHIMTNGPKLYDIVKQGERRPIFGISKLEDGSIPESIDTFNLQRLSDFGARVLPGSVIFIVDIPDEEVILTDFYNWSDRLYFESEFGDIETVDDCDESCKDEYLQLKNADFYKIIPDRDIQAIFHSISISNIIEYKEITDIYFNQNIINRFPHLDPLYYDKLLDKARERLGL